LHKDYGSLPNCGETWEISGVKSDVSVVADGALEGESLADLLEKIRMNWLVKKFMHILVIPSVAGKVYRCE